MLGIKALSRLSKNMLKLFFLPAKSKPDRDYIAAPIMIILSFI
jgi:hypothetical protein